MLKKLFSFFAILVTFYSYAKEENIKVITTTESSAIETQDPNCPVCVKGKKKPLNFWAWGGAESIYVSGDLGKYLVKPFIGYQAGGAKGLYQFDKPSLLYLAGVFDMATSKKMLGLDSLGYINTAVFSYANAQILLGYQSKMENEIVSFFGELGPVYQTRSFIIRQESTAQSATDYIVSNGFGAVANFGLNLYLFELGKSMVMIRFGANFDYARAQTKALTLPNAPSGSINVNAWSYALFLDLGFKF